MIDFLLAPHNYHAYIVLLVIGLYAVLVRGNLIKKIIGLNILQTSVFLFYLTMAKVDGGTVPVLWGERPPGVRYENPLPHVLILTAIVVGLSLTAVALAIVIRIKAAYGTVEEEEILARDLAGGESR